MIDPDDYPSAAELAPDEPPERLELRVCECGQVGRVEGSALSRCGRDSRHNMRYSCPTTLCTYELVPEGE